MSALQWVHAVRAQRGAVRPSVRPSVSGLGAERSRTSREEASERKKEKQSPLQPNAPALHNSTNNATRNDDR